MCILAGEYFENVVIENAVGRRHPRLRLADARRLGVARRRHRGCAPRLAGVSGLNAVFTIVGSQHVELRSFAVEAADDEIGILLDRAPAAPPSGDAPPGDTAQTAAFTSAGDFRLEFADVDVTLHDLVIANSTFPAILALDTTLLQITENRIATRNVRSLWPAVSVCGNEIHIERNWVGLQDAPIAQAWLPASVAGDLATRAAASSGGGSTITGAAGASELPFALAGIQIAGPARDVFVIENEIEGGRRNGITLGSLVLLDANGDVTGTPVGVLPVEEDPCCDGGTIQVPPGGPGGGTFAAGGLLVNIQIDNNRIRDMGLCGIGPVGFFDLEEMLEVISIENLTIAGNDIANTLLSPIGAQTRVGAGIGYGAICVPDVANLVVRDNTITDFGLTPAAAVCGIFILHAEMAEISRNQVLQTQAWTADSDEQAAAGLRAGILALLVTPPDLNLAAGSAPAWAFTAGAQDAFSAPVYQPGMPAIRVEHNVVQVALGEALEILGLGPFSVVNNSLSSGGTIALPTSQLAVTVLIANLGAALVGGQGKRFTALGTSVNTDQNVAGRTSVRTPSNGTVIFTNNICQLETRAGYQHGFASVLVGSLDHVLFGDNVSWVDGLKPCADLDAVVIASTVQVTSNRFQETGVSVFGSCLSLGVANITTQNIADNSIIVLGSTKIDSQNLVAP